VADIIPKTPKLPDISGNLFDDTFGATFDEKQVKKYLRGKPEEKLDVIRRYQDKSIAESALEVIRNFGGEAKDIISGIPILGGMVARKAYNAVTNPADTIESITSGEAWDSLKDGFFDITGAVADDYKDRYGDLFEGDFEAFAAKQKDKPLSFLLDLGAVFSLAGGAARAGGAAIAKTAATEALEKTGTVLPKFGGLIRPLAEAPNALGKVGVALENAGRVLDPLQVGKAGIKSLGTAFPEAPIFGANAQADRMYKKLGIDLPVDEANRLRFGYFKEVDGKRVRVPGLEEKLIKWDNAFKDLSAEEILQMPLHLSGLDDIPLSAQSEAFRKAADVATDIFTDEENLKLFGITKETARRRVAFPLIQKYVRDGTLPIDDELFMYLNQAGIARKINGKIELVADKGLDSLPSKLFDDQTLLPIQSAVDKAIYVPLLDGERTLTPTTYFGRITRGLDRSKSAFEKSFAGAVANKYLKTKDPTVIADIREVGRMFMTERANAQLVQNLSEKIFQAADPVTGDRLAKPLYLGKVPTNIAQFQNGADVAAIINNMDNPLKMASIDDVYKKVHGKTKSEWLAAFRKENRGISNPEAIRIAEQGIAEELSKEGFDGFLTKSGDFLVFDQAKHPYPKLLDGHVAFAPKQLVKQAEIQQKIAAEVAAMGDGVTLEEALNKAITNIFPDQETLYKHVSEDMAARSSQGLEAFNDELLDPAKLAKFKKDLKANLKGKLKVFDINDDVIKKLISQNDTPSAAAFRKATGGSVNSANWVYQIPKSTADSILATVKPNTNVNALIKTFWDSPLQLWRSLILNYSGRWHLNNFFGNAMLNTLSGTLNPIDYMRAGKVLGVRLADRYPRAFGTPINAIKKLVGASDEEFKLARDIANVMPPELAMGTFARAENQPLHLMQAAVTPIGKLQSSIAESRFGRAFAKGAAASADFNSLVDQFFRDAQFFKLARGQIRQETKGVIPKIVKSFYVSDDAILNFAENMSSKTATEMVDKISEFLPNYLKLLNPTERRVIRRIVPFYSWYKHMFKTTLMLPLNHPKRAALVAAVGRLGDDLSDQELKSVGLDPKDVRLVSPWLKGTIPWGHGKRGPKFLSLRAINPLSTLVDLGSTPGTAFDPRIQYALERITGVDMFTQRPLPKRVVIGPDGNPKEVPDNSILEDIVGATPQTELIRRLVNPTVESQNGEVVFRRDRFDEVLKLVGINRNEQDVAKLKEKAKRKRGELAGQALNQLLGQKKKDPKQIEDILDFIRSQGE